MRCHAFVLSAFALAASLAAARASAQPTPEPAGEVGVGEAYVVVTNDGSTYAGNLIESVVGSHRHAPPRDGRDTPLRAGRREEARTAGAPPPRPGGPAGARLARRHGARRCVPRPRRRPCASAGRRRALSRERERLGGGVRRALHDGARPERHVPDHGRPPDEGLRRLPAPARSEVARPRERPRVLHQHRPTHAGRVADPCRRRAHRPWHAGRHGNLRRDARTLPCRARGPPARARTPPCTSSGASASAWVSP